MRYCEAPTLCAHEKWPRSGHLARTSEETERKWRAQIDASATWCDRLRMASPDPEILTTKQATELLQVSRFTLYRLVESGDIPALRVGGQLRFDRAEILEQLRTTGVPT